jgi:hypothetical protein
MPKSKFASTMKNRIKCENDIRKVGYISKAKKRI